MDVRTRIYLPYWEWEDFANGLYAVPYDLSSEILAARELLSSRSLYGAMGAVVDFWPRAARHNLTNLHQNRRAWLGQAACRLAACATAVATRAAWGQLTDDERDMANGAADRILREWGEVERGAKELLG